MITCYIGIGSNLGDRHKFIDQAIKELKSNRNIKFDIYFLAYNNAILAQRVVDKEELAVLENAADAKEKVTAKL